MKSIKKDIKSLFRFDAIRISKLLEIAQYTILAFILGFFFGGMLNKYMPNIQFDNNRNQSAPELFVDILLNVFFIAIALYYSEKILKIVRHIIPFYFSLSDKYIPCMKNECIIGITMGLSISFFNSMPNFMDKIKKLYYKIFEGVED